ncbi:MAG TPA: hypothetical protein VMP11_18675 [Verrucomicrobiae bacterium]|nr:hypothetical protein [Verrucomicrobiae bacterium]
MKTIYLIPLLLLSACASNPKLAALHVLHSIPGTTLPTEGIESVRYSENIKAYNVGRYADPNNALVMHERHVVYRVETTAKWNLHPNAPAIVALGPAVRIIDAAHQDGPTTPEIIAEVNRQKAATRTVIEHGQRMNDALTHISSVLDASKQVAEQNRQLKTDLDLTKQRLDLLETEIRSQQQASPAPRGTPENTNQDW